MASSLRGGVRLPSKPWKCRIGGQTQGSRVHLGAWDKGKAVWPREALGGRVGRTGWSWGGGGKGGSEGKIEPHECTGCTLHWQEGGRLKREELTGRGSSSCRVHCQPKAIPPPPPPLEVDYLIETSVDHVPTSWAIPGGLPPVLALAHVLFSCSSIRFLFLQWSLSFLGRANGAWTLAEINSNRHSGFVENSSTSRFPGGAEGKESACDSGAPGSVPGWERSPGGGNGNPLQYSSLENSTDRGAWLATVHGVTKSRTRLSD